MRPVKDGPDPAKSHADPAASPFTDLRPHGTEQRFDLGLSETGGGSFRVNARKRLPVDLGERDGSRSPRKEDRANAPRVRKPRIQPLAGLFQKPLLNRLESQQRLGSRRMRKTDVDRNSRNMHAAKFPKISKKIAHYRKKASDQGGFPYCSLRDF